LITLLFAAASAAHAADPAPDEILRQTTEEVVNMIKQDKDILAGDRMKSYTLVETRIVPHFDFVRMTRLALGKNWTKATPEQQTAVVDSFRNLLIRTYSSALSRFRNQVITYKPWSGSPADTTTTVQSTVSDGGRSVPIDYAMAHVDNTWKVYDIKVDGISLVTNYRSDFNDRVTAGGIDGLIKDLQDKARAAEGKAGDGKPGDSRSAKKS
jgi:phospholipid transport system substrate-binding protein